MVLTPEQNEDFERKILKLSEFAKSIGLKFTNQGPKRNKAQVREMAPEEVKISGVRNLTGGDLVDNVCECKITYIQD